MRRTFLLRDANGRNVDAVATLELIQGNRQAHFSLTCNNGSAHDLILEAAAPEVRRDLETLARVHMRQADGVPVHGVSNATYHVSEGRYAQAVATLGAGTVEDLHAVVGAAAARAASGLDLALTTRRDALYRASDELREANEALSARAERNRDRFRSVPPPKALAERRDAAANDLAKLMGVTEGDATPEAGRAAAGELPERLRQAIRAKLEKDALSEEMLRHVTRVCIPAWGADLADAMEAIAKPDFRAEGRPAIDDDPTTLKGFASAIGATVTSRPNPDRKAEPGCAELLWDLAGPDGSMSGTWPGPRDMVLDAPRLLENFQSDFACVETARDMEDFLDDLGYASGGAEKLRTGRKAYETIVAQREAFTAAFGMDAYRSLMTSVGDDPPMQPDWEPDAASAPRP